MPEMHSQMLICNDRERKCEVSVENIEKRRRKRSADIGINMNIGMSVGLGMGINRKIMDRNQSNEGIFTTKINLNDGNENRVESRIDIAVDPTKR